MNNITICISSDNNYIQHAGAVMASVLQHKQPEEFIKFYIIDGGITGSNKEKLNKLQEKFSCKIEFLTPDFERVKNCKTFKSDYITTATYYRLLIPEIIPNEDRVLYLDCDTIVRKPLGELYNKDFENNLIIGVKDIAAATHSKRLGLDKYVNGGVLLFNSKQMRAENSVDKMFEWIDKNRSRIECHDQDVINAALKGRIGYTDDIYDAQVLREGNSRFDEIPDPVILHFIGPKKPWTVYKPLNTTHWGIEYFTALKDTPWKDFIKQYKLKRLLCLPFILLYPTGWVRTLLRNIFSVKNTGLKDRKIITILGIKFKVKCVKRKNIA